MSYDKLRKHCPTMDTRKKKEDQKPPGKEQLRGKETIQDGVHGMMRKGLLQPREKIGGILWRPYVLRGTKKLDDDDEIRYVIAKQAEVFGRTLMVEH